MVSLSYQKYTHKIDINGEYYHYVSAFRNYELQNSSLCIQNNRNCNLSRWISHSSKLYIYDLMLILYDQVKKSDTRYFYSRNGSLNN